MVFVDSCKSESTELGLEWLSHHGGHEADCVLLPCMRYQRINIGEMTRFNKCFGNAWSTGSLVGITSR